jgi:hypothetical protein
VLPPTFDFTEEQLDDPVSVLRVDANRDDRLSKALHRRHVACGCRWENRVEASAHELASWSHVRHVSSTLIASTSAACGRRAAQPMWLFTAAR